RPQARARDSQLKMHSLGTSWSFAESYQKKTEFRCACQPTPNGNTRRESALLIRASARNTRIRSATRADDRARVRFRARKPTLGVCMTCCAAGGTSPATTKLTTCESAKSIRKVPLPPTREFMAMRQENCTKREGVGTTLTFGPTSTAPPP